MDREERFLLHSGNSGSGPGPGGHAGARQVGLGGFAGGTSSSGRGSGSTGAAGEVEGEMARQAASQAMREVGTVGALSGAGRAGHGRSGDGEEEEEEEAGASGAAAGGLPRLLRRLARRSDTRVLRLLFGRNRLWSHLAACHHYLLLARADFVTALVPALEPILGRPATEIGPHVLIAALDGALRSSSAARELPPECIQRLCVRLEKAQPGDTGRDIFVLDYQPPLALMPVLSHRHMAAYRRLSGFLLRVRRARWTLTEDWSRHAGTARSLRNRPELRQALHALHLARQDMALFMHTLESFATLEVLGGEWNRLRDRVAAARALPDVVDAVGMYLHAAMERLLLAGSRKRRRPAPALQALIGECLRFAGLSQRVLRRAGRAEDALGQAELDWREAREQEEEAREQVALGDGPDASREERRAGEAARQVLDRAQARVLAAEVERDKAQRSLEELGRSALKALGGVVGTYRRHLMALLAAVRAGGARLLEWRALTVQFDFNEFYEGRARAGLEGTGAGAGAAVGMA